MGRDARERSVVTCMRVGFEKQNLLSNSIFKCEGLGFNHGRFAGSPSLLCIFGRGLPVAFTQHSHSHPQLPLLFRSWPKIEIGARGTREVEIRGCLVVVGDPPTSPSSPPRFRHGRESQCPRGERC